MVLVAHLYIHFQLWNTGVVASNLLPGGLHLSCIPIPAVFGPLRPRNCPLLAFLEASLNDEQLHFAFKGPILTVTVRVFAFFFPRDQKATRHSIKDYSLFHKCTQLVV